MTYAIIPARSGSKGLPDKNIRKIAGRALIDYSVSFAKSLKVDRIFCSTDSERYAAIARSVGAEVPFLRSSEAAQDHSMEEHILEDLNKNFSTYNIPIPDIFVWLRPTFLFRDLSAVQRCISRLVADPELTACRIVTEADPRLYLEKQELLVPVLETKGRSMIRRQEFPSHYRVFNTDVFRGNSGKLGPAFLGDKVACVVAHKICALDIDDESDFQLVSAIVESSPAFVRDYLF